MNFKNKQTNQANKQANRQTDRPTDKQMDCEVDLILIENRRNFNWSQKENTLKHVQIFNKLLS